MFSSPLSHIMSSSPLLFIDARNALYRAIYASKADKRHQIKYHYFVIFLRQITTWMNKYRPSSVHVFWDAPRASVWRRLILKSYKDRSTSTYVEDISEDLFKTTKIANEFFKVMNVRQYFKKQMEADDLIYAATTVVHPKSSVIISTDSDMVQIPFTFASSRVYDPKKQEEKETPEHNPIMLKSLVGDKSDAINGYYGIGPVKGKALLQNQEILAEFLKVNGNHTFRRNMILIDLSLCPRLFANKLYIQKIMSSPVCLDKDAINKLVNKYKVVGFHGEFVNLTTPFMSLE